MTSLEWWFTGDNYPNLALFPVIENWVYPQFWLFKKSELRNWFLLSNFRLGHFFKRNHWATTRRPWGFRRNEVSARDSKIMYSLWWRAQQIPPAIIRSKTQALIKVVSFESSFARHCHSTRSITRILDGASTICSCNLPLAQKTCCLLIGTSVGAMKEIQCNRPIDSAVFGAGAAKLSSWVRPPSWSISRTTLRGGTQGLG